MDLLYIWVEEYINIKKQGFCFSGTYDIAFNEDKNEVSIEKFKYPIPSDFWGKNISSITAIIGKNGAGKTNLLELLLEVFSLKNRVSNPPFTRVILVFGNYQSEFKIFDIDVRAEKENSNSIQVNTTLKEQIETYQVYRSGQIHDHPTYTHLPLEFLGNIWTLFYSPILDYRLLGNLNTIDYDGSINKVVEELEFSLENNTIGSNILHLQYAHVHEVIALKEHIKTLPDFDNSLIKQLIPDLVSVVISSDQSRPDLVNNLDYSNLDQLFFGIDGLFQKCRKYFNSLDLSKGRQSLKKNINRSNKVKFEFYLRLIKAYFLRLDIYFQDPTLTSNKKKIKDKIGNIVNLIPNEEFDSFEVIEDIFAKFFLGMPKSFLNDKEVFDNLFKEIRDSIGPSVPLDDLNGALLVIERDSKLETLFSGYNLLLNEFEPSERSKISFISFNWHDLSSGEKAFLKLFSKLYQGIIRAESEESIHKIILIIDEGEIGFHPQWQREFMNRLTSFLELVFSPYQVQIFPHFAFPYSHF